MEASVEEEALFSAAAPEMRQRLGTADYYYLGMVCNDHFASYFTHAHKRQVLNGERELS